MPSPVVGGNRTHNILMKDGPVNHLTNRPTARSLNLNSLIEFHHDITNQVDLQCYYHKDESCQKLLTSLEGSEVRNRAPRLSPTWIEAPRDPRGLERLRALG